MKILIFILTKKLKLIDRIVLTCFGLRVSSISWLKKDCDGATISPSYIFFKILQLLI